MRLGGLGVASSNLAAPTRFTHEIKDKSVPAMFTICRRLQPFTIAHQTNSERATLTLMPTTAEISARANEGRVLNLVRNPTYF
jgi:hypothetical protein